MNARPNLHSAPLTPSERDALVYRYERDRAARKPTHNNYGRIPTETAPTCSDADLDPANAPCKSPKLIWSRPVVREIVADEHSLPDFSAADLDGRPIPPRSWIVKDMVPDRTVTLLSGDAASANHNSLSS